MKILTLADEECKALWDYYTPGKLKDYDLILVPSESFGVPGYFRMAYCIDTEKVKRSIGALERFVHEQYGK